MFFKVTSIVFSIVMSSNFALAQSWIGEGRPATEAMAWEKCGAAAKSYLKNHFDQMIKSNPNGLLSVDLLEVQDISVLSTSPYRFVSSTVIRANYKTDSGDMGSVNKGMNVETQLSADGSSCSVVGL